MTPADMLLLVTLLPMHAGGGLGIASEPAREVRPVVEAFVTKPVSLARAEQVLAASGSGADATKKHGWSRPAKLLVLEGTIVALGSAGHIAKVLGKPPNDGAEALGVGLIGIGGLFGTLAPMGLADSGEKDRGNIKSLLVGCAALVAAGGYDLYLSKNNDGGGGRILRHNLVALNGVWLVTWGIARWRHW